MGAACSECAPVKDPAVPDRAVVPRDSVTRAYAQDAATKHEMQLPSMMSSGTASLEPGTMDSVLQSSASRHSASSLDASPPAASPVSVALRELRVEPTGVREPPQQLHPIERAVVSAEDSESVLLPGAVDGGGGVARQSSVVIADTSFDAMASQSHTLAPDARPPEGRNHHRTSRFAPRRASAGSLDASIESQPMSLGASDHQPGARQAHRVASDLWSTYSDTAAESEELRGLCPLRPPDRAPIET
jgi:hypothetical protein